MNNSYLSGLLKLKIWSKLVFLSVFTAIFMTIQVSCFSNTDKKTEPESYIKNIVDADGSLKRVIESKVLRIGTDPNSGMPYIKKATFSKDYNGFEADISKYISNELGCSAKFVPTNWVNLYKGLEDNSYDIILNAIEKPEDDKTIAKNIGFSTSYFINTQQIVVLKNNNKTKFLIDLKNKKVGVLADSTAKVLVSEINKMKHAGITLVMYTNIDDLFSSLKKNLIEAVITDTPIGTWNCQDNKNNCKLVGITLLPQNYVIAVRKEDRALLNGIDAILRNGKKNNKIGEILNKWNLE